MDFGDNFCAHHQALEVVLSKENNSVQLYLWGPSYGCSKRATVRLVPKLGFFSQFLLIHLQTVISLVLNEIFQKFNSLAPSTKNPGLLDLWSPCYGRAKMVAVQQFLPNFSIHVQT